MTHKEALTALVHEMEYVLSCINADKVPFDGDDFHEALRLGKEALAQPDPYKQGYADAMNWKVQNHLEHLPAAQPEQEPAKYKFSIGCRACGHLESYDMEVNGLTTPPQRKPLTDEQILSVARDHYNPHQRPEISFARAIEAAHGIK